LVCQEWIVWISSNNGVEAEGLEVGERFTLVLDPTGYGLLDSSEAFAGRFFGLEVGFSSDVQGEGARGDHAIDHEVVELDFRGAWVAVDAQEHGIDVGFTEIDFGAEESAEEALPFFDEFNDISEGGGRPSASAVASVSEDDFGQCGMGSRVSSFWENDAKAYSQSTLSASDSDGGIEFGDNCAGFDR